MVRLRSTSGTRADAVGLGVAEVAAVWVNADAVAAIAVLRSSTEGLVVSSALLE